MVLSGSGNTIKSCGRYQSTLLERESRITAVNKKTRRGKICVENQDVSSEQDEGQLSEKAKLFAELHGLIPTTEANIPKQSKKKSEGDSEGGVAKTVYRRPGHEGVVSIPEIEERISAFLLATREKNGLSQRDFASLISLTAQVWGRYERAYSSLDVSRLIVISEIFGLQPAELLGAVAPHLFGSSEQGAKDRIELFRRIGELPDEVCSNLLEMVKQIERLQKGMAH